MRVEHAGCMLHALVALNCYSDLVPCAQEVQQWHLQQPVLHLSFGSAAPVLLKINIYMRLVTYPSTSAKKTLHMLSTALVLFHPITTLDSLPACKCRCSWQIMGS